MSNFEKKLRSMLSPKENELLDTALRDYNENEQRDASIAFLLARTLRRDFWTNSE